jgi:hypothetical protein
MMMETVRDRLKYFFGSPFFLNFEFNLTGGELWLVKEEGDCSGERMANT